VNISAGDQYITLAKVDVDKFSDLCIRYKIEAVPTGRAAEKNTQIIFDLLLF